MSQFSVGHNPKPIGIMNLPEGFDVSEQDVYRMREEFKNVFDGSTTGSLLIMPPGATMSFYHPPATVLASGDQWARKLFFMMVSQEERDLVTNILKNPGHNELRLVYADWLGDHGRMIESEAEREVAQFNINQAKGSD